YPVLMLTGTPMTARPRDLHALLDMLWPGRFGRSWLFQRRYCGGHHELIEHIDRQVWVADGASHVDELARRLRHCMLRRTKAEVASDLPALQRIVRSVEMPAKARRDLARAVQLISWDRPQPGVQDA